MSAKKEKAAPGVVGRRAIEDDRKSWPELRRCHDGIREWVLEAPEGFVLRGLFFDGMRFVCVTEPDEGADE